MPYLSKETMEVKRRLLKAWAKHNGFKLSIRRVNHSSIYVTFLSGPIDMNKDGGSYTQVNHFYIDKHYENYPEIKKVLNEVYHIMNYGNGVEVEDGDYGTVPNFYTDIRIGNWDKPYVTTTKKVA